MESLESKDWWSRSFEEEKVEKELFRVVTEVSRVVVRVDKRSKEDCKCENSLLLSDSSYCLVSESLSYRDLSEV